MPVPFIDLSRFVSKIRDEVLEDWRDCLDETAFVLGARVGVFEAELARWLDAREVIACGNGTDALVISLQTSQIGAGARVAVPNLTFWATYEAVVQVGAEPVLLDVDPEDLHLDLASLEQAHERRPLDAVILVHLFGWCATRTAAIRRFCADHGIRLVEDAAQAFGVSQSGASILATADVATLSFYPAKVLGGSSDGGAMLFKDPELAATARKLTNHGRSAHYSYSMVGHNSRMSSPNAAFLRRMLGHADEILESRRSGLARYRDRVADLGDPRVRLFGPPAGVEGNGYLAVVTVDGIPGPRLAEGLRARGIGCARTYPETLCAQPPAAEAERVGDLSVSRAFCERVVNLPLFAGITPEECDRSFDALAEVIGE